MTILLAGRHYSTHIWDYPIDLSPFQSTASISGKSPHYTSFNNLLIPLKKLFSDYAVLFLIAGIVILLDQLTKAVLRQNLMFGEIYHPELWNSQYIRFIHLRNTAATNGMFQNMSGVLTVFPFVVAIVILYYFPRVPRRDWLIRLGLGLYLGGALGNLIDRLRQGYVTDFISVGYFPVFNLADACVSLGVVCLSVGLWLHEKAKKGSLNSRNETISPA